ncbi:MAG: glycosyltransferase family protein [Saprospiraceae bacterium]
MKILFGIQGTGNGHLSRAKEIIPHLEKYGTVDLYVSGTQAEVQLAYPILYKKYGWSFIFGQKGGVDIMKTFKSFRPRQLLKDTFNCPVKDYDLIINDYEPITAWACRLRGIPCYGLSHQGAYLSEKSPRPTKVEQSGEYMLKHFSPTTETQAFHFARYDDFINTPVIRSEIRALAPICKDHIAVYLPAVGDDFLISIFSKIKMLQWKVFSKRAKKKYIQNNVEIHPVSGVEWEKALESCEGAVMGAGFEGPAEALFLKKKLFIVPMKMQYEQQCNAASLKEIGVRVSWKITSKFEGELRDWLSNDKVVLVDYPDETAKIVERIIHKVK